MCEAVDEALDEALDDILDDHDDAWEDDLDEDLFSRARWQKLAHIWAIIFALSVEIGECVTWIANSSTPLLSLLYR